MVVLRLPSLCASLLALLVVTTVGSGTACAQFTSTLTGFKIPVPAPAPANTFRYTVQGTFSGNYPIGNKAISHNYVVEKKVGAVWVSISGPPVGGGVGLNPLAGGPYSFNVTYPITTPPPAGDEYRFKVSYSLVPNVGLPGLITVVTSPVTTVLP